MQALVALPVILGWTKDLGLISSSSLQRPQLVAGEVVCVTLVLVSYGLARQVRRTSAAVLAELADAKRIIGDQRQLLGEVQNRVEQIKLHKVGRWTGRVIGRWQLGEVLGRGAMGEVYEASDGGGGRAAVKVLTPVAEESQSLVARFEREMQIALRLDSPHIVRVLDMSSQADAVQFLAMERLRGTDLAEHLRAKLRMTVPEVVAMLQQVASGVEVAHDAGVVHRDLKPHNLFLHDATCWKVLDFGVAKVFGVEGTLTHQAMVGTPQYMAPEQASGESVTHLSDIYALGAIAYRCLTGRVPHEAKEFAALIYQVVQAAPVRPGKLAEVPREVEDVLAVAMAKEPRRRFASATEFVEQLAAAAGGRPTKMEPPAGAWS
jgi:serine/threonine protein kinase